MKKAASYIRSRASAGLLKRKRVSVPLFVLRTRSCFGDEKNPACDALHWHQPKDGDGFYICSACECGPRKEAALSAIGVKAKPPYFGSYTKLHFPYLECPKQRPGFSNAKEM